MKQVTLKLRDGRVEVLDTPFPALSPEGVLVDIRASLLSAGTERSKVQGGRQNLVAKARSRPEQVRQVVEKVRRDGVAEALEAVRLKLDQPQALGYSAAGVVLESGARVSGLVAGDRVACAGGGYAVHAEVDHVPGNLCVRIPDGVDFAQAAFGTVGSIALQGVRQSDARIGERVAVIGLGLVGQLAARILRAAGCEVVGIDMARELVEVALAAGIDRAYARGELGSALPGTVTDCDAVVITAATPSADPVELAARLCRDRGRVVVVGDVGMAVPRGPYYDKELDLRLSRSYGPGRYDRMYEERGIDYPIGYVRWTERRNLGAFLELVATGRVRVDDLISNRYPVDEAAEAYERLLTDGASPLGVILEYEATVAPAEQPVGTEPAASSGALARPDSVGVIGAGSFAQRVLIPGLRASGFTLTAVASATGPSAHSAAGRFGFSRVCTAEEAIADADVGTVVVATRHDTHARLAAEALRAGKAVFVEKPPALDFGQLTDLRAARDAAGLPLAVGFNRRHAPLAERMRAHVADRGAPITMLFRVNAGLLAPGHWLNDLDDGGGRLLGEGCHFVDFVCWLAGAMPARIACHARPTRGVQLAAVQEFSITLDFADGSLGTVIYSAGGASGLAKEYVEAHAGGRSATLEDFRTLVLHDGSSRERVRSRRSDKGHVEQLRRFRRQLHGEWTPEAPDPLDSMEATLAALRSAETGVSTSPRFEPPVEGDSW
jgi:predicted dehydrogenase/threonine dehydrogenase-like Zn-dependent dehydrogenase